MPGLCAANFQRGAQACGAAILQFDLPTQAIGNGLDDGQPQPCSLVIAAAVETLEQPSAIVLVDARPLIFDGQLKDVLPGGQRDPDESMQR
ncbi:hypothetical protein D3C72_2164290 [compost metagenome]